MTKHVFALLITLIAASGAARAQAQRPPNVVILLADDLGYADLGSYGNPYIRTPTLDELAREGQRWTDFYVSAPVCSPSRGSLLTGQVPVRSGLYGNRIGVMFPNDTHGIRADHLTMAEALESAGYSTGIFGKWHLGDDPEHFPTRHGFDYWFGIPYSNDMDRRGMPDINEIFRLRAEGRDDEVAEIIEVSYEYYENPRVEYYDIPLYRSTSNGDGYVDELVERPADQPTLTRRLTEEAVAFIERHRNEPFLAYVPYTMPHLPLFSGEAFAGSSLRGTYGDVVEELDWSVARICRRMSAKNTSATYVIASSRHCRGRMGRGRRITRGSVSRPTRVERSKLGAPHDSVSHTWTTSPRATPATTRTADSVNSWRMSLPRVAPIATRIAISRSRLAPGASRNKLTLLAATTAVAATSHRTWRNASV